MPDGGALNTVRLSDSTRGVRAAAVIRAGGGLVAFPTETVYGLGVDANDAAVAARLRRQGPAGDNPLIVHLAKPRSARPSLALPPLVAVLAGRFWPGPLTLVVPRARGRRRSGGRRAGDRRRPGAGASPRARLLARLRRAVRRAQR